jgi:hypothetical protein
VVCRQRSVSMDVRWRERDWEPLREEVAKARPSSTGFFSSQWIAKVL